MFKLAFMTDPHLAPLPRPRIAELMSKRIFGYLNWRLSRKTFHNRAVLDRIVADLKQQKPEHIAVGGDLVNIALRHEFAQALEWLQSLGSAETVSLVPGNHDAYVHAAITEGISQWRAYMTSHGNLSAGLQTSANGFPWVRQFGQVALIGLSSAIATPPLFASGELGTAQRDVLRATLNTLKDAGCFRVVMVHHPPLPGMSSQRRGLSDADSLREILEECGAELVLFGHRHFHHLSAMTCRNGEQLPLLGGPSASAAHGPPNKLARYYVLTISENSKGWHCDMVARGTDTPNGSIVELERKRLIG